MDKINLVEKFKLFQDYWNPKIVGDLNEAYVKLVKLKGEFVWHRHDREDELFLIVRGTLRIKLRDGEVRLREGELVIIPRGVDHLPVADEEVHVILIEPKTTVNTGNVRNHRTVLNLQHI